MAYEQRAFWRNRTRAFFSFGMPVMLLLLFGALNSGGRIQELGNIPYVTFFLPGILAYGIVITQFVNMAGGIAIQRDNGLLKRMRGTPLPGWAYVAGRLGSTALVSVVMTVVMLVIGRVGFDVHLRAAAVPAVVVTVLLGAATFAALGMAAVMIIPNAEAAPVVANVLILPLSFISGIWYPLTGAPEWLVDVAKFFPLEHLANALHVAFDPLNHGSAWSGNDLFVLAIWLLVGARLAMRFWQQGDGALSAQLPDRFEGARGARRGHLRDLHLAARGHRAAGRRAQRRPRGRPSRAALVVFFAFFFQAVRGRLHPKPPRGRRARLRHRPGHRRRADRRRPARLEPALLLRGGHGRPAPAAAVERRRAAGHLADGRR